MDCVIYGVGSPYVHEVDEILIRLGWPVRPYVVNMETNYRPAGLSPLVDMAGLDSATLGLAVVFALTTPGHRQTLEAEARAKGFTIFPAVVDPTTVVAGSATMGEGAVVNSNGSVGPGTWCRPYSDGRRRPRRRGGGARLAPERGPVCDAYAGEGLARSAKD
jgi:hypothetical protein